MSGVLATEDREAVTILTQYLNAKTSTRRGCIKALYEIGDKNPELIRDHLPVFLKLLSGKDNRMQWGAMTAIGAIARDFPMDGCIFSFA